MMLFPCRILRSVLLSAAVIRVRPVLIIRVGTHWRQVKGIKSHLTLSGESRIKDKQHICGHHFVDVTLLMSFCWCHSGDLYCWCHFVNGTILKAMCWFHFVYVILTISLCSSLFVDFTFLMSLCWCQSDVVILLSRRMSNNCNFNWKRWQIHLNIWQKQLGLSSLNYQLEASKPVAPLLLVVPTIG